MLTEKEVTYVNPFLSEFSISYYNLGFTIHTDMKGDDSDNKAQRLSSLSSIYNITA